MTDENLQTSQPTAPESKLISGIYWRKSLWNGAATVPVILALEDGALVLKTNNATVFAAPITAVKAKFTAWGTMLITVEGKQYDFVGTGATFSKAFSDEQKAQISQQSLTSTLSSAGGFAAAAGAAINPAVQVAGASAMVTGYFIGLGALQKWNEIFQQYGVASVRGKNASRNATILVIGIIVVVFVATSVLSVMFPG